MRYIPALLCLAASLAVAADFERPFEKEEGWRPLLNGKDFSAWLSRDNKPNEWFVASAVSLDSADPKRFTATRGAGPVAVNSLTGKVNDLYTSAQFGDCEIYVEWMVPKGSNSGVYLQGLYEIQIFDSFGVASPNETHAGGIYHQWIDNKPVGGSSPRVNASRAPGEWQYYHAWFRAPRLDAAGKKIQNAKFLKVVHNGQVVQENVEVAGPTRAHMELPESLQGPIMLQGDHGPVAYRNIYIKPLRAK